MSVRASMSGRPFDLLGRHVRGRPDGEAERLERARLEAAARDAEVGDDDAPVGRDEDVVGLEVAVDDARRVGGAEPRADRADDLDRAPDPERPFALEEPPERLPFDELHREEALAAVLADVERARDVLVRHPPRELHLPPEPLEHPRRIDELAAEHFERDDLVELRVARVVDAPHSADADEADELVAPGDEQAGGEADRVEPRTCEGTGSLEMPATTVSSVPVTFRSGIGRKQRS